MSLFKLVFVLSDLCSMYGFIDLPMFLNLISFFVLFCFVLFCFVCLFVCLFVCFFLYG